MNNNSVFKSVSSFAATLALVSLAGVAQANPYGGGEASVTPSASLTQSVLADRSFKPSFEQGLYIVGVGENDLRLNPAIANLPTTAHQATFVVGVGEIGLIEIQPKAIPMANLARK